MSRRTEFKGLASVVGYTCAHGATVPMQGVSDGGAPWLGLFCAANICLPSWRNPADPWLVSQTQPGLYEQRERMAAVACTGVLAKMRDCPARKEGVYG